MTIFKGDVMLPGMNASEYLLPPSSGQRKGCTYLMNYRTMNWTIICIFILSDVAV